MSKSAMDFVKTAKSKIQEITVEDALGESYKDALFLDTREPTETAKGTIADAVLIPRGLLEFQIDPTMKDFFKPELATDKKIVVYCASGGRSSLAVERMQEMGYDNAVNLLGGYSAWKNGGGKTTA